MLFVLWACFVEHVFGGLELKGESGFGDLFGSPPALLSGVSQRNGGHVFGSPDGKVFVVGGWAPFRPLTSLWSSAGIRTTATTPDAVLVDLTAATGIELWAKEGLPGKLQMTPVDSLPLVLGSTSDDAVLVGSSNILRCYDRPSNRWLPEGGSVLSGDLSALAVALGLGGAEPPLFGHTTVASSSMYVFSGGSTFMSEHSFAMPFLLVRRFPPNSPLPPESARWVPLWYAPAPDGPCSGWMVARVSPLSADLFGSEVRSGAALFVDAVGDGEPEWVWFVVTSRDHGTIEGQVTPSKLVYRVDLRDGPGQHSPEVMSVEHAGGGRGSPGWPHPRYGATPFAHQESKSIWLVGGRSLFSRVFKVENIPEQYEASDRLDVFVLGSGEEFHWVSLTMTHARDEPAVSAFRNVIVVGGGQNWRLGDNPSAARPFAEAFGGAPAPFSVEVYDAINRRHLQTIAVPESRAGIGRSSTPTMGWIPPPANGVARLFIAGGFQAHESDLPQPPSTPPGSVLIFEWKGAFPQPGDIVTAPSPSVSTEGPAGPGTFRPPPDLLVTMVTVAGPCGIFCLCLSFACCCQYIREMQLIQNVRRRKPARH